MRRLLMLTVLLLAVPVPAGAGGGGGMSLCSGFATGSTVSMLDSCFDGTAHFAPAGETISIVNDGELPHSYTAVDGSFDTGELQPGETYEVTVSEPRLVEVFCTLHGTAQGEGMAGVLVVGEAEPPPLAGSTDEIKEAVSTESQALAAALDNQSQMIAALTTAQVRLTEAVEAHDQESQGTESATAASVVPWVALGAGAVGGLVLSAAAYRFVGNRRGGRAPARTEAGSIG